MLVELETGLVALLRASPLASRLRQVDSLPDLDGDSLLGRFSTDAPAVYVAMGSFPVVRGYARPKFGIACVAKNSRSQQAARHGDGVAIGLYEMLDAVMTLVDGATVGAGDAIAGFEVLSCDQVASEAIAKKGLYVGVVPIQASADVRLQLPINEADLAAFRTFHAATDIDAQASAAEHSKWLQEPPDYSTSAPGLTDTLKLQE